ncbi:MAG: alpha-2-macroglobulin [Acidobacteriota bacterium]|nr:alpha-2-macroglobulin [Acidobacteriota bacterium]
MRELTKTTKFIVSIFLFTLGAALLMAEPRFYLSTDKIFTPGEEAFVTLEARGLPYIDIRVYRIDDPIGFFLAQDRPHQPVEVNEYAGVNALEVFRSVFDRDLLLLRDLSRRFVNSRIRADITGNYETLKGVLIPSNKKPIHSVIKLLGKYPLLRHFRHIPGRKPDTSSTGEQTQGEDESEGESEDEGGGGENYSYNWLYEKIPIFESTPGVYLVEGVNGSNVGYTMVVISRLALITKQSGDSLLCYVVDKISGQPLKDNPVTVLNNATRKKIVEGKTDKQGLFFSPVKEVSQLTIISGSNKQFSIIDPSFFPVSVDHRKVYMYTDRPVYRPGQDVFYKGIVRDFLNENYQPAASAPVEVTLYDPRGNKMGDDKTSISPMGTFNGRLQLNDESPLGTYKLIAVIQGKSFQAEFKIQEYRKPRFMVDVKLEGSGISGSRVNATVTGKYYYGPPVQDAPLHYYVYRTRFYVPWWADDDYSWYYSDAEYRSTNRELITDGEGKLDQSGLFNFNFETKRDSDDYTYIVEVRVKDKSDYTVSSSSTIKTSAGQFNIGIRSQRLIYSVNQEATVTFYTLDLNNRPASAGFDFKAVHVAGLDKNAKESVIFNKHLESDKSGRASVTFKVKKSGHVMLIAKGIDKFNNVIESSSSIWVATGDQPVGYAGEGIEIVSDKTGYQVGDNAKFLVLCRVPNIPFLFTVEGGNLYYYKVHKFSGNSCLIEIPLKAQYTPNVYVQAAAIVNDRFFQRQKTVIIPPAEKFLKVSIKTDKPVYLPGDTVKAEVLILDYKKQPVEAEVSLGVVDEAIYAISPELVVDMQKFFYPRKRCNVRTNNSLIFNFYGYSQELKPALAAMEMRPDSGLSSFKLIFERKLRQRFKDTCFWIPAVMTDRTGKAEVSFQLPDNITQWRFTARVVNAATQVGAGVEKAISRRDLSIQVDPPQSFTEGDELVLPVLLRNVTPQPMKGNFEFEVKGGKITAPFNKSFSLQRNSGTEIPIKIKVIAQDSVELIGKAAAGNAWDGIKLTVPVTPYGVEKMQNQNVVLAPTEKSKTIRFSLPEEGYKRFSKGNLYVHANIYRAVLSSLNYLAAYPYGCVEQTMSGFLPDVVLAGVLEKQKINNPELKNKVDKYIYAGIQKLLGFQGQNGFWGWWNEGNDEGGGDYFTTAYVMYGLSLARNLGYKIDQNAYDRGINALEKIVALQVRDEMRVMCLYVLTLADRSPGSIIMDMYNKRDSMSNYTLSIMTLTLAASGKKKEANTVANLLLSKCTTDEKNQSAYWDASVQYRLLSENARIETTAFALQALMKTQPKNPRALAAAGWLMAHRQSERWSSTRDTAAAVIALSEYIAGSGLKENTSGSVNFRLNNSNWYTIPNENLYSDKGECWMPLLYKELKKGENILEIQKNTGSELFVNLGLGYYSREAEVETLSGPLKIARKYYRLTASPGGSLNAVPLDNPNKISFKSGEEFLVELRIDTSQPYDYMVLEDFIPAGFQVIEKTKNYQLSDSNMNYLLEGGAATFKEARDNRMVFFFNQLNANGSLTVCYLLRATLEGEYQVNPAVIRSMYYDERRALSQRFHVKVTK